LIIPSNFNSENIEGTITIPTEAGDLIIPFKLNIQSLDVKLDIQMQSQFTVYLDPATLNLKTKELSPQPITINNTGNVDLNLVSINLGNDCKNNWPEVSPILTQITQIPNNDKYSFFLKFTATNAFNQAKTCTLDVAYYDPKQSTTDSLILAHKQFNFSINISS